MQANKLMNAKMPEVQCVNCGNLTHAAGPCVSCWCPDPQSVHYTLAGLVKRKLEYAGSKDQIVQIKLSIPLAEKLVDQEDARLAFIRMIAGLTTTEGARSEERRVGKECRSR